jgi:hypothetical protein
LSWDSVSPSERDGDSHRRAESLIGSIRVKKALENIPKLAVPVAAVILMYNSKNLMLVGFSSKSASMHIPMYIIYTAIFGMYSASVQMVMTIINLIRNSTATEGANESGRQFWFQF